LLQSKHQAGYALEASPCLLLGKNLHISVDCADWGANKLVHGANCADWGPNKLVHGALPWQQAFQVTVGQLHPFGQAHRGEGSCCCRRQRAIEGSQVSLASHRSGEKGRAGLQVSLASHRSGKMARAGLQVSLASHRSGKIGRAGRDGHGSC
jgi:hypothetical protein